jgi:hypothetical protein
LYFWCKITRRRLRKLIIPSTVKLPWGKSKYCMCFYISNFCLRNETNLMYLIKPDRLILIHIPENRRCVAEVVLYSIVGNNKQLLLLRIRTCLTSIYQRKQHLLLEKPGFWFHLSLTVRKKLYL